MLDLSARLELLDNIDDLLDYDYSVNEVVIESFEEFKDLLLDPHLNKERQIFYRGERISSLKRPLLPTMFRDRGVLVDGDKLYTDVTAQSLFDFYESTGGYIDLFRSAFGEVNAYCMYDLCAFSQHYLNWSPFIDFTKSLFAGLSFGLKDRTEFEDNLLLYTVEVLDSNKYTQNKVTAECWLNDYHVRVFNPDAPGFSLKSAIRSAPEASIIDIATNDRMKFQQGVFLLLDHFDLVNNLYFTRNVRSSVTISKYSIAKEICPRLTRMVHEHAPWYSFSNLLEVGEGIKTAIMFYAELDTAPEDLPIDHASLL